ncbi:MAG: hypothetical protein Q8Q81_03720 [Oxalobacteraceae bacterium]|nr:hypothetical protein [Oxalobacteraceae bacterium]
MRLAWRLWLARSSLCRDGINRHCRCRILISKSSIGSTQIDFDPNKEDANRASRAEIVAAMR